MPRPKNNELKRDILRAARASFRERGYDATSYAVVAEACGISRNLVQYHFPKKQLLAIGFMERLLDESRVALGMAEEALEGDFAAIYAVGTCYFEFLLQPGAYREFLADVIRNRDLTEEVLAFNAQWALARVGARGLSEQTHARVMHAVIVQMGGFYELLYHCLKTGEPFDVADGLYQVMREFLVALGHTPDELACALPPSAADPSRIAPAVRKVNEVLL